MRQIFWGLHDYQLVKEQDLRTVFKCCSLGSPFKILPCGFFLMGMKYIFLLSNHMAES